MDYSKMWYELKKHILSKNSHGKNELLDQMMKAEINESDKEHAYNSTFNDGPNDDHCPPPF